MKIGDSVQFTSHEHPWFGRLSADSREVCPLDKLLKVVRQDEDGDFWTENDVCVYTGEWTPVYDIPPFEVIPA